MTYLIILLVILFCVIHFDILGYSKNSHKWYLSIWIYLTLVSGLAYRLGGDGIVYVWQYPYLYNTDEGFGWEALTSYNNRLPAWVLLNKLCKLVTTDYWFFKFVHAIIVNSLFGYYIKTNTKYIFSSTLIFYVLLYFDLNFQLLRQVLAIGFFLYGLKYYNTNKWLKYYLLCISAVLFHESALIAFVFPFMKLIKLNLKTLPFLLASVFILFYVGKQLFNSVLFSLIGSLEEKALTYYADGESSSFATMLLNILLSSIIPLIVTCYTKKNDVNSKGAVVYGLCYAIGCNVTIFYRFSMFYQIFSYVFYIELFYSVCANITQSFKYNKRFFVISYLFIVLFFLAYRGRMYFSPYGDTGKPTWVQYYPYSSIITKEKDPEREQLFNRIDSSY